MVHPATLDDASLLAECDLTRTRRSGPGGQRRNKVETAVVLDHRPSGLRAEGSESRSPQQNEAQALFRLRVALAVGVRQGLAVGDWQPSPLWQSRCSGGRVIVNPEHADFPPLLAEALDVLFAMECDAGRAAESLGCSTTQLVKFLAIEPRALAAVNAVRVRRGDHRLR